MTKTRLAGAIQLSSVVLLLAACGPGAADEELLVEEDWTEVAEALEIDDAVYESCSTSVVRGLSQQLIDEIECLRPGTMESFAGARNIEIGSAVFPYLQRPAARALERAAANGPTLRVNSALRTLAQQFLLYRWYQTGECGIRLAAGPGKSLHERGLAVDLSNYSAAKRAMERQGFGWFGGSDPVHFDFRGGGTVDIRGLSVLAFQRLWNRNHPSQRTVEDGLWGPDTRSKLLRAPGEGFESGATCR